jgi:hypothetical protein
MKNVRHRIPSECWSVDDDEAAQTFQGWDYVLKSIKTATQCHIDCDGTFVNCFPGDHYKLLAGLIFNLDRSNGPVSMVDIGTHYGTSARVMLDFSDQKDRVTTFDVVPYTSPTQTYLTEEDFSSKLTQRVEDLKEHDVFVKRAKLLTEADFIMCDGPKDGIFERTFLSKLSTLQFPSKPRWLLLDDIKWITEQPLWRLISSPKVDLTSFGHFSGTGLVDISEGLKLG